MVFSDFHDCSHELGAQTAVDVPMPEPNQLCQSKAPVPVLYLLHGLCAGHTRWLRQIEKVDADK